MHKSERDFILLLPSRKFHWEEACEMELSKLGKIWPGCCLVSQSKLVSLKLQ